MAILDSLKKLGRKMTGSPVQGTDIESAIDSIANNYSCGGSDQTAFIIRFRDPNEMNTYTCDTPYDEIFQAIMDEKNIIAYVYISNHPAVIYQCAGVDYTGGNTIDFFHAAMGSGGSFEGFDGLRLDSTNTVVTGGGWFD